MKFQKWSDILKDAKLRVLPTTHDSVTMFMKKEKAEKAPTQQGITMENK